MSANLSIMPVHTFEDVLKNHSRKPSVRFKYGANLEVDAPLLKVGSSKWTTPIQTANVCTEAEGRFTYSTRIQKVLGQKLLARFFETNTGASIRLVLDATLLLKHWGEPTALVLGPRIFAGWITGKQSMYAGSPVWEVHRPFDVQNIPFAKDLWVTRGLDRVPLIRDPEIEEVFLKRYIPSELRRPYPEVEYE